MTIQPRCMRLWKQQHQHTPHHKQASDEQPAGGSWLFAAGNRWRQHKLHFRREAAAAAEAMRTHKQQDEGNVEKTCHACQGRLPEDRWRMMGGAHMIDWEEQLWTHTSMVMVGTSNHSDAVISSVTAITTVTIIAIDCIADITLRLTPAPIWREEHIAHVTRSHEER
ncbi:hypothetical protein PTSG_11615 [Salpingoeca rosetta]|uniref:Uncharacterized protein n=1 Tax=Salpingoeca rosetta (strain ATCC 50818 / BSB-021) TaxID=946362 RepID=F2TWX5_SALR5|nr:uncharacterized protein PTSG_11615 [Salpingoeca rosetta]EGD75884.1 hypothetical protein PTSG_11615 [Salpingoeca rosetta]|eukprot:XP_004998060.1 hypothetical protein PTSG_11615 [Salpingoeca rosetta]